MTQHALQDSPARGVAVSLSRYRAWCRWREFQRLPDCLRNKRRLAPALRAIALYAWEGVEHAACPSPDEARQICRRLEEFLPPSPDGWRVFDWLRHHQVDEAWAPGGPRWDFLAQCLCEIRRPAPPA